MSTHLTRPLLACRLRDCGAPDCPVCAGAEAARQYREQQACDHDEHDHGLCSSNCTRLEDIASSDHAACIAHLRSLNPRHLANILAKPTK